MSDPVHEQSRFRPGDEVVLRYVTRDGKPGMSWPYRVVEDRDDLVALHIPAGTTYLRWARAPVSGASPPELRPEVWRREVLRLMFPDRNHSVWLFWSVEAGERRFTSYYVNFEEPFRRTAIGFDTNDHMLDIVVSPERDWRWKDKDDFEERVRNGTYTAALADLVWEESARVIAAIEEGLPPFAGEWEDWHPDPANPAPVLQDGWQHEPVAQWALRRAAYGDAGPWPQGPSR